jgi:hypothetical protein
MPTITTRNADRLQHVAVTRLQLYIAGQVHALAEVALRLEHG